VEELLRTHRDQAFKILQENRAQSREGIELLVRARLEQVAATMGPDAGTISPERMEDLYREMLELSFSMFSLGFAMAHTMSREPAAKQ
jgi:hypothetical protein